MESSRRQLTAVGVERNLAVASNSSPTLDERAALARDRLSVRAELDFVNQTDFPEPRMRINADRLDSAALGWSEASAWDGLAAYYRATYLG